MKKNTARLDEPIWDSRNSDEPEMNPVTGADSEEARQAFTRYMNRTRWWEYPVSILLIPVAAAVWLVIIALFLGIAIPVGIIGASISWLMKAGR